MAVTHKHPLVAFREANKLSQDEAAALVRITQTMWSRLETGTGYASPAVAKRICDLTGCALDLLLNFGDNGSADVLDVGPAEAPSNPKDMP